jgi:hypothetical protein
MIPYVARRVMKREEKQLSKPDETWALSNAKATSME